MPQFQNREEYERWKAEQVNANGGKTMKGTVLDFSVAQGEGLISGDDQKRYTFSGKEWKSQALPSPGTRVDFDIEGKNAIGVYLDSPMKSTATASPTGDAPTDKRYQSLYCSSDEKILLGLCGGLAHKFGLPPAAMRVVVFISMFFVVGFLYLVGIFLPKLPTKGVPRAA